MKVMVYTRAEWKEMTLAKDNHNLHYVATIGQIFLEKNDRVKFIVVPKPGGRYPDCSRRSSTNKRCAIGFHGENFDI